jgi:hypothetical protein
MASLGMMDSLNASRGLEIINDPLSCVISDYGAGALDAGLGDEIQVGESANLTVAAICASSVPVFVVTVVEPIFVIVGVETWAAVKGIPFAVGSLLIDSSDPVSTVAQLEVIPGLHPVLVSAIEADYLSALQSVQLVADASLLALFVATSASALLSSWAIASTRRREIGMLAALGMKSKDIAHTLAAENAVAMIGGVVVGFVAGLFVELAIAEIVVRFGGSVPALIDWRSASLISFSLVVSIVLAFVAIRRATKARVIDLLRDLDRPSS